MKGTIEANHTCEAYLNVLNAKKDCCVRSWVRSRAIWMRLVDKVHRRALVESVLKMLRLGERYTS